MKKSRIQKFIALSGLCSRRKAEELIKTQKVRVNNKLVSLGDMCYPDDEIKVDGMKIRFDIDDKVYIVLNKKKGYTVTKSDELSRKTVFDILKEKDKRSNLFSVGRLDKNTTGLLILTNDGEFTQSIIHPSKKISKEYRVTLDKRINQKNKDKIEKGLVLDGYKLGKCKIELLENTKLIIKIYEGRKRQIRRIFEMVGYRVTNLHRFKIGDLNLDELNIKDGEYKLVEKYFLEKEIIAYLPKVYKNQ